MKMIEAARQVISVDHSKFDKVSLVSIACEPGGPDYHRLNIARTSAQPRIRGG